MANRSRRRCRNCPADEASSKAATKLDNAKIDQRVITVEGEAARLWNHVLFGTGTVIGLLRGYTDLNLPGHPLPQLRVLLKQITDIVAIHEHRQQGQ